jgi:hypothetical protein
MLHRNGTTWAKTALGSKAVLLNPSRHIRILVRSSIDSCRGAMGQPALTLCATNRPERVQQGKGVSSLSTVAKLFRSKLNRRTVRRPVSGAVPGMAVLSEGLRRCHVLFSDHAL